MAGKHRKEVQRQLAELKLIPRLSELFDTFIWKHGKTMIQYSFKNDDTEFIVSVVDSEMLN